MAVGVTVLTRGPLFTGALIRELAEAIEERGPAEVAQRAYDEVQRIASADFRNPTGYYQSQIEVRARGAGEYQVWDQDVVYGPWLEGVSTRNQTTRFKGYRLWRRTAQYVERMATDVFVSEISAVPGVD